MNRDHQQQIITYINFASQAYDNNVRRHLNNENMDTINESIVWIYSMLFELRITSIYDTRPMVIHDEGREINASVLECITTLHHPYHEYARRIMRLQHMNRNKIEFINGITNLIIAEQEIYDMTEAESSENEELLAEED